MKRLEADRIRSFVITLVLLKKNSHRKVRVKRRSIIFFQIEYYNAVLLSILIMYNFEIQTHS